MTHTTHDIQNSLGFREIANSYNRCYGPMTTNDYRVLCSLLSQETASPDKPLLVCDPCGSDSTNLIILYLFHRCGGESCYVVDGDKENQYADDGILFIERDYARHLPADGSVKGLLLLDAQNFGTCSPHAADNSQWNSYMSQITAMLGSTGILIIHTKSPDENTEPHVEIPSGNPSTQPQTIVSTPTIQQRATTPNKCPDYHLANVIANPIPNQNKSKDLALENAIAPPTAIPKNRWGLPEECVMALPP